MMLSSTHADSPSSHGSCLQQLLRRAYRHSSRSRPSPVALALGPMSQSSPADFFQSMDKEMARMQQSFQQMEEQVTAEIQEIDKKANAMQNGGRRFMNPYASQTYRNKQQSEHRDGAGYIRSYRAESITYYGHPSGPLLHQQMQAGTQSGFVTLGLLALMFTVGSYLAVATRLAVIWDRTRYSAAQAAKIIPLWPFLTAFSADFRREIRKAIFGRKSERVETPGR